MLLNGPFRLLDTLAPQPNGCSEYDDTPARRGGTAALKQRPVETYSRVGIIMSDERKCIYRLPRPDD